MSVWKKKEKMKFSALGIGKGKTIKPSEHQTGTSIKRIDIKRQAMPSGKRISKFGKIYYEYRKNRSDLEGGTL